MGCFAGDAWCRDDEAHLTGFNLYPHDKIKQYFSEAKAFQFLHEEMRFPKNWVHDMLDMDRGSKKKEQFKRYMNAIPGSEIIYENLTAVVYAKPNVRKEQIKKDDWRYYYVQEMEMESPEILAFITDGGRLNFFRQNIDVIDLDSRFDTKDNAWNRLTYIHNIKDQRIRFE